MATAPKKPTKTVRGKYIDPATEHLIPSSLTDQGREGAKIYGSGATVTGDGSFDKKLEQFEVQTWMSHDPMSEALAKAKAAHPERSFRFLSDRLCARNGMRGFQPVISQNGDPVSVAGLKLGFMPNENAEIRRQYYANEYREQMENSVNSYQETQDRLIAAAGAVGSFDTLKPGSVVSDPNHPDSDASIGLSRVRGGRSV